MGLLESILIDVNCDCTPQKVFLVNLLVINWGIKMVYFLESPRTCFGENRSDISNLNPSFFLHMLPKPLKKSNEKATQKRKANKGQPTNPKIVSLCQQPTLEGLNHFALNWAFNEPKSGELGGELGGWPRGWWWTRWFSASRCQKKGFAPKWEHCPSWKWSNKQKY